MAHNWLTAELALVISEHLDPRSYVRMLSVSQTTLSALAPRRAEVVFPQALKHMAARIKAERQRTVDPEFTFDSNLGQFSLVFKSNCGLFETTFGVLTKHYRLTDEQVILILVSRSRIVSLPESVHPHRVRIGRSSVSIFPSIAQPFSTGRMGAFGYFMGSNGQAVMQCDRTVRYTEDFDAMLRSVVHDMCPLRQDFTVDGDV